MKQRPSRYLPAIVAEAAMKCAAQCHSIIGGLDGLAAAIASNYTCMKDGFDLGKALDNDGYSIDAQAVEELDTIGMYVSEVHNKHCEQWVKDNDIKPSLALKTLIIVRGRRGIISGICKHNPACYEVTPEEPTEREAISRTRFIIPFEEAKEVK